MSQVFMSCPNTGKPVYTGLNMEWAQLESLELASIDPVLVVRTSGAPYAAAWIDGTLRVNPAFVVMAAAPLN
jgi:hypothetical protein